MSATASDVLSGISDPSANLGSLNSGVTAPSYTPNGQPQNSIQQLSDPLNSGVTAPSYTPNGQPQNSISSQPGTSSTPAFSGASNTLTQGTSSGDTTSGGGITSDITKLLSQLFGGNGGSTLGLDMLLAGYGLDQASKQRQENTAQADQLKQVGQPFIGAGQGLLDKFKSGQINPAQQDVANTAQQQGNDILGLPQNAMLSKISQDYLSNVANQKLNPGDQAALDQSTQAAKQKLAQSMAASGITDSSVLDAQNAQIDQQAAINKQTLLNSYQQTGNAAFDKFVSTTEAGQKLILQGKQYVVTSLEQELQDALSTTTEGLGPLEQAIQLQINSDTQLATSVGQLMSGLAQAYSMSLWKSGSGSGSSTGGTLDTIGNLWNDVKGLFGSNSNTTTNSGSGSGTTNTGLPGSTTTGTTSTGGTYSGTQGTTTVGSQVSNPSSGGSGGSGLGSLTGDAGTAYGAADQTGLLGGSSSSTAGGTAASGGTSTGSAATGAAAGSTAGSTAASTGGELVAQEGGSTAAGDAAGGISGLGAGVIVADAVILADMLGAKGGLLGSNSVNPTRSAQQLQQLGLSMAPSPVSGSPQGAIKSDAAGLMVGLGNNAAQGSGQYFYKDASGNYTWAGRAGTKLLQGAGQVSTQLMQDIKTAKDSGNLTTGSDGTITMMQNDPSAQELAGTGGTFIKKTVLHPDGSITWSGYTRDENNNQTPFETTDPLLQQTYAQYGKSSTGGIGSWITTLAAMGSSTSGTSSGTFLGSPGG